jgi:hypothetical protein
VSTRVAATTPASGAPASAAPTSPGTRWQRWADLGALAVFVAAAMALHWSGLLGGPAYYERDTQLFYYPLAHWIGDQLRAGHYPLWIPAIFTGYPIFADGELGLLYLPQVLLLWSLPTALAIVWLRVLHVVLAATFMFIFLRTLRVGRVAAVGGGLVFAFGSFLTAQMHHENVVRSAVWLPLVLAAMERGFTSTSLRRQLAWLALAALAYAQSALGLHIQPVLMEALAIGGYALFRVVAGPWPWLPVLGTRRVRLRGRLLTLVLAGGGVVVGGLAVAGAQWLPLAEWAFSSFRRGGVNYEFGSAYGLAPSNLITLLFPYFFRLTDDATWWSYWQQWETELYVGIPTLVLAIVGVAFARRRETFYFVLVGAVCLWISMAAYAPLVNVHQLLWSVPGFSFLRAPGRFSDLVVFAAAGLSAFGLDVLGTTLERNMRRRVGLTGAAVSFGLAIVLLALLPATRAWLLADAARGQAFLSATYLDTRLQFPIDPSVAYTGTADSLDLANPKTLWSVVLLGLTGGSFALWLSLGPSRARIGQVLLVSLIGLDLLVFAADFHPRIPLDDLAAPVPGGIPPQARVLIDDPDNQPELAPNQLVTAGLTLVDGYSSLPSERHLELFDETAQQPRMIGLWSAPYLILASQPADAAQAGGVQFGAQHVLASVVGATPPVTFTVPASANPASAIRLVGTLDYAFDVPQGSRVGDVIVTDANGATATYPVRAGVELAERAIDRPSLRLLLAHQKPPGSTALDFEETTPQGEDYLAHLYLAQFDLPVPTTVATITIAPAHPTAVVDVHGVGVVSAGSGQVTSLTLADRAGFALVGDDGLHRVLSTPARPRAFVVDRQNAMSPAAFPNETPVQALSEERFNPDLNVLIEGDRTLPADSGSGRSPPRSATVEDQGPDQVRITASVEQASYLVLSDASHRGWSATVDGQPAPLYVANALFRAVALEPGQHTVVMRFLPPSHVVGLVGSLLVLIATLAIVLYGFKRRVA